MPYSITRGKGCSPSKPWGVVKDSDGTVVACHATKESALAQIRALYKVEPALAKARERVAKHPGHADQKSHGGKGTPAPSSPARQKKMTGHWGHSRTGSTSIATASRDMMGIQSRVDVASRGLSDTDYKQAQIALDNISSRPAMVTVPLTHTTSRMPELEKAQTGDVIQLGLTATATQERGSYGQGYAEDHIKEMQVLVFTGTKPTHLYSGRRSAPEEAIVAGEFRVVGKKTVDVPRTTFRNGVYEPWTSKATVVELEQVSTFDTSTKAFVPFSQPVAKHLPHQHDQQKHGTGGTSAPDSAPKKRNKKDIAGDDQRASELYASGKTWDEVATEMGYANGGVARRAGKRHEERQKDKPTDDGATKPKTEDVTPPTPVITPPVTPTPLPVDIVNPRPMTGEDRSQQTVPTDDINVARETGRPYAPFTEEGHSPEVRKAQDNLRQAQKDAEDHYEQHFGEESRRRSAIHKEKAEQHQKAEKEWEAQNPRAKGEDYYPYWERRDKALAERGLVKPKDNSGIDAIIKDGLVDKVYGETQSALHKKAGDQWDVVRRTVQVDTAEHILGVKSVMRPRMEPDWDTPRTAENPRPMKQATEADYDAPHVPGVGYPRKPAFDLVYELPDGKVVNHQELFRNSDFDSPDIQIIKKTAESRLAKISQINTRQRAIDGDGDGKFNEAMKTQLSRQQAIVDSPNTRIVIHAPVSAVGGIVTSGRFKSQHETGRSKGYKGKEVREGFEASSMGTVLGDDKTKAPIYGAVHVGGVQDPHAFSLGQYGDVGFVLRRDTHERAMFTDGDSLNLCYEASPMTGVQTRFNGHSVNGGVDAVSSWRRQDDATFPESLQKKPKAIAGGYREAQVLGGVNLADIEYVTVPAGTKFPAASRRKLEKAGIPVIEYDRGAFTPLKGVDDVGELQFTPAKEGGIWTPLPEPTAKRIGVVVDIFKHLAGKHDQRSHSGKSSSHGGYQLNEPKNPQAPAGKYGEDSVQAAKAERTRIAEIEPAMTREMIDIANTHGAKMEGLDHRLKSDESLARKVDAEKDTDFGGDATKTAQSMSDVVRYTMTYPEAEYAGNVQATITDMEARGYKARVKNYWEMDDPYQGINVALTHPSGIKVELQFHTPRSVKVKETVHGLLDKFRAEPNARTRFGLWDRMVRVSNQIPVPPPPEQLLSIGDLKSQTFKMREMREMVKQLMQEINNGV
jgi:flagellar motor switch/type III secretory pathway protein FliN